MVVRVATRQLANTARAASGSALRTQIRACHLCHSVKEWKENHGIWSKAPKQGAAVGTSPRAPGIGEQLRAYATGKSLADEKIEEITEAFNTAKDEFELAWEETENNTVYAEGDREAAQEELKNTLELYQDAVQNSPAEIGQEIQERIGHRIRELEAGFKRLDELVQEGD